MCKKVSAHIGALRDMAQRFIDTWHRLNPTEDSASCDLRASIERGIADSDAGRLIELDELIRELGIDE